MRRVRSIMPLGIRSCFALGLLGFAVAVGSPADVQAAQKVKVCHIPPGNPANFHTILISENALAAHLAHGDLAGACNDLCGILCDDGDACTVDDAGDCEQQGCPSEPRQPVNCDDARECTIDSCDATGGCAHTPDVGASCDDGQICTDQDACTPNGDCQGQAIVGCCLSDAECDPSLCKREACNLAIHRCEADPVVCDPPDLCTVSACDDLTGNCVDAAVECPEGEECNPSDGQCKAVGCSWASFDQDKLHILWTMDTKQGSTHSPRLSRFAVPSAGSIGARLYDVTFISSTTGLPADYLPPQVECKHMTMLTDGSLLGYCLLYSPSGRFLYYIRSSDLPWEDQATPVLGDGIPDPCWPPGPMDCTGKDPVKAYIVGEPITNSATNPIRSFQYQSGSTYPTYPLRTDCDGRVYIFNGYTNPHVYQITGDLLAGTYSLVPLGVQQNKIRDITAGLLPDGSLVDNPGYSQVGFDDLQLFDMGTLGTTPPLFNLYDPNKVIGLHVIPREAYADNEPRVVYRNQDGLVFVYEGYLDLGTIVPGGSPVGYPFTYRGDTTDAQGDGYCSLTGALPLCATSILPSDPSGAMCVR